MTEDAAVVWHHRGDTLLRMIEGGCEPKDNQPYYTVYIPIGIHPGTLGRHNVTVEYAFDKSYHFEEPQEFERRQTDDADGRYLRVGLNAANPLGAIQRITPDFIAHLRHTHAHEPREVRPYLDMDDVFRAHPTDAPAYYEAALHFLPANTCLRYRIRVYSKNKKPETIGWYAVYVGKPLFAHTDIKYWQQNDGDLPQVNMVYWKVDEQSGLTHFRVDFVDTERLFSDFHVRVIHDDNTETTGNLGFTWHPGARDPKVPFAPPTLPIETTWGLPTLPMLDPFHDIATFTLSHSHAARVREVMWRGAAIAKNVGGQLQPIEDRGGIQPIRLMFIHYANQSLNDLFETPNKNYSPPRSFIQTMMSDELGTYSSRPNSNETGVGDGFNFVTDAHARNHLPFLWSYNGGFLALLAQDAPAELKKMRERVKDRLLEPAIGGWGGHRMLYFEAAVNQESISTNIDQIQHHLRTRPTVFCPNSRVYAAADNIDMAILGATAEREPPIGFVVVDEPAFSKYDSSSLQGLWGDSKHAYLWRQQCQKHRGTTDPCTADCRTWYWLFIDRRLKDELLSASTDDWRRGKLGRNLRLHYLYGASHPEVARHCLFVYEDDADKAAGTGWFDGDYNGIEANNAETFDAALEWIAAHPWLTVVTTADLEPEKECVGTVFVRDAIDPFIHQDFDKGETPWGTIPQPGTMLQWAQQQQNQRPSGFEYGSWYEEWATTQALWLARPVGDIVDELEALLFAQGAKNELDSLARLAFLIGIHEPHWSKEPLEPFVLRSDFDRGQVIPKKAFQRRLRSELEDFAVCASLQLRNANVFRCAARWAEAALAGAIPAGAIYKDNEDIRFDNPRPDMCWDLDVTPNVILYSDRILVVMDQNGGRITHVFAIHNHRRAVTISGNIKAYQFLGDERQYGGRLPSDGDVFQNTVSAPNHLYIANDLPQSRPRAGKKLNRKPKIITFRTGDRDIRLQDGNFGDEDWLYPDNFNCYQRRADMEAKDSVVWAYPGLSWTEVPTSTPRFEQMIAEYRDLVRNARPADEPVAPAFTKHITLTDDGIEIAYRGRGLRRHLVANEFSLDHLGALRTGMRQERRWSKVVRSRRRRPEGRGVRAIMLGFPGGPAVNVELGPECRFSSDTLEGEANGRLHRAFSDCLEVQGLAQNFQYSIRVL